MAASAASSRVDHPAEPRGEEGARESNGRPCTSRPRGRRPRCRCPPTSRRAAARHPAADGEQRHGDCGRPARPARGATRPSPRRPRAARAPALGARGLAQPRDDGSPGRRASAAARRRRRRTCRQPGAQRAAPRPAGSRARPAPTRRGHARATTPRRRRCHRARPRRRAPPRACRPHRGRPRRGAARGRGERLSRPPAEDRAASLGAPELEGRSVARHARCFQTRRGPRRRAPRRACPSRPAPPTTARGPLRERRVGVEAVSPRQGPCGGPGACRSGWCRPVDRRLVDHPRRPAPSRRPGAEAIATPRRGGGLIRGATRRPSIAGTRRSSTYGMNARAPAAQPRSSRSRLRRGHSRACERRREHEDDHGLRATSATEVSASRRTHATAGGHSVGEHERQHCGRDRDGCGADDELHPRREEPGSRARGDDADAARRPRLGANGRPSRCSRPSATSRRPTASIVESWSVRRAPSPTRPAPPAPRSTAIGRRSSTVRTARRLDPCTTAWTAARDSASSAMAPQRRTGPPAGGRREPRRGTGGAVRSSAPPRRTEEPGAVAANQPGHTEKNPATTSPGMPRRRQSPGRRTRQGAHVRGGGSMQRLTAWKKKLIRIGAAPMRSAAIPRREPRYGLPSSGGRCASASRAPTPPRRDQRGQ